LKDKLTHTIAGVKQLLKRTSLMLLVIVGLASATIIVVNYYSIRILSGARAYNNGESEYSKGQKDAAASLTKYIYLGNEADYAAFLKNISVCQGDRDGRIALSSPVVNYDAAKRGFLQGRNHPDDIDLLIWVFVHFKSLPLFNKAVNIWVDADGKVNDLYLLGLQAHQKMVSGGIPDADKRALLLSISNTSARLTILGQAFSETLGIIGRRIALYVFIADVFIMLVIVISAMSSAAIMIRNLDKSKKQIIAQNDRLQAINAGLDKFVYNVTHDLRSPLASLSGLLELIEHETDPEEMKPYIMMMKDSLERQDKFINEMLTFIKSKHTGVQRQECSLPAIVDNVIAQNGHSGGVKFYQEIELKSIESDGLKLQVILNNLVSNSIKYSDTKKPERWVKVSTYRRADEAVIEVADNGIGIRQKDQERIFDKFYMSGDNKRSAGLGLYLVKDAVTQLNGKIEVKSEPGESSTFTISLPYQNGARLGSN
jgi:signal transduction histidine kinase